MADRIKLIWDFYGGDAEKIAQHHQIHLEDYVKSKKLKNNPTGYEFVEDNYAIAYLVVDESEMIKVRDNLKPHRAIINND